jgi:hypothetical protein
MKRGFENWFLIRQRSQTFLSVFMPTHNTYFCFIFAAIVAQDVEDILADFVRHGDLSYALLMFR